MKGRGGCHRDADDFSSERAECTCSYGSACALSELFYESAFLQRLAAHIYFDDTCLVCGWRQDAAPYFSHTHLAGLSGLAVSECNSIALTLRTQIVEFFYQFLQTKEIFIFELPKILLDIPLSKI